MNSEMFASLMNKELQANEQKGDWNSWRPDQMTVWQELDYHMFKLRTAMNLNDQKQITEYAADCGNILMKIVEKFGLKE